MNKLDKSLHNLLIKKYDKNDDLFDFKKTRIDIKTLKLGITIKHFILKTVLELYSKNEIFLCYYDTDIINIILEYIIINNKLPRICDKKECVMDKVSNYLGITHDTNTPNYKNYKKDVNYFNSIYPLINNCVLENFKYICEKIIIKFSQ